MGRYNPPPYSPHYDFIALRPMTIQGVDVQRGETIDKSHFKEQRLRQMFDARMIAPAGFADSPKPAFVDLGLGKADQLRAEIEREEAEARKNPAPKGEGDAQPRSDAKPAAPQRARAAKPPAPVGKKPAQRVGSSKPAAKSAPKRAAARSR